MTAFIKVPFEAYFRARYPAPARDLYVGLRGLLFRKTGDYEGTLETSCDEIMSNLHLARRTVWRRLESAETFGLLQRLEGDALLNIRLLRPWESDPAAPCAENGTPLPQHAPTGPSAGPAGTSGQPPRSSITTSHTQTGSSPVQVRCAENGTRAENGTLLKDVVVVHPDSVEDEQQQPEPAECAESGTPWTVEDELREYLEDEDVIQELAGQLTMAQVQHGIIWGQRKGKSPRVHNPQGLVVKRWRAGAWAGAPEIPADVWNEYADAGYQDIFRRLEHYLSRDTLPTGLLFQ